MKRVNVKRYNHCVYAVSYLVDDLSEIELIAFAIADTEAKIRNGVSQLSLLKCYANHAITSSAMPSDSFLKMQATHKHLPLFKF